MDYEELKREIRAIAEIANTVPEPFREKCFEILLQNLLDSEKAKSRKEDTATPEEEKKQPSKVPTPAQIRVLMSKTGVTQEHLESIVLIENGECHFVREPKPRKVARGQVEWALLLALRNGILNNSLSVDPEDVRSICQEKGFYDAKNFATNFKTPKVAKFFRNFG